MRTNRSWLCFFGAAFVCSLSASGHAEDGVSKDSILFGQVAALNGPAQALGQGMREGILAAFEEANRAGGINGRKLELKSIDDGYEPEKTIEATNKAIKEEKVFALVGAVGTPTSKAGQPIATAAKVPFIGPFTGAEFLRNPFNRYVVNIRASYFQETEAWIEHLTNDLGITRIAILYQDDAFGLSGLAGVKKAMEKRNLSLVAEGTFKRNTTAIKSALLEIMKGQPQAVVTVGPYKPIAAFIKLARQFKVDATFVAISFVGSDTIRRVFPEFFRLPQPGLLSPRRGNADFWNFVLQQFCDVKLRGTIGPGRDFYRCVSGRVGCRFFPLSITVDMPRNA